MEKPKKIQELNRNLETRNEKRLAGRIDRVNKYLTVRDGAEFEIGKELLGMLEERDFPDKTFERFVERVWGWRRQRGYELMESYRVKAGLPENVINLLQNPGQAKALKAASEPERAKILEEVASTGEVTAKKIAEKIKEKKKPVEAEFEEVIQDANGEPVPKNIQPEFLRAEREGKEAVQRAQLLKNYLEQDDLTTVEARSLRETAKDLLAGLKTHLTKHVLCPKCAGKKCAVCSRRGFVSKHFATKGMGKHEE